MEPGHTMELLSAETIKQNKLFRVLFERSEDGMWFMTNSRLIACNKSAARQLGYDDPSELEDIHPADISPYLQPDGMKSVDKAEQMLTAAFVNGHQRFNWTHLRKDGSDITVEVTLTSVELEGKHAFQVVWRDITDRLSDEQKLKLKLEKTTLANEYALDALTKTVSVLAAAVELRDPYTAGHQMQVARVAVQIGECLALDRETIAGLRLAASIHDVGKISVPAEILTKPTRLTVPEFEIIKQHPITGANLVREVDFEWPISEIILQHHERLDGSGYPDGLTANDILMEARIIAVADTVDAMASHRPYRAALTIETAMHEIEAGAGIKYDPDVVRACTSLIKSGTISY